MQLGVLCVIGALVIVGVALVIIYYSRTKKTSSGETKPEDRPEVKKDAKSEVGKKEVKKEDEGKKRKLLFLLWIVFAIGAVAVPQAIWGGVISDWWWTKTIILVILALVIYGFGADWTEELMRKALARATFVVIILALAVLISQKMDVTDEVASAVKSVKATTAKMTPAKPKRSAEDEEWAKGRRFIAPAKGWITINCPRINSWSIVALPPQADDQWEVSGEWGKYIGGGPGSEKKAGPPLMSGFKIRSHSGRDTPIIVRINFK